MTTTPNPYTFTAYGSTSDPEVFHKPSQVLRAALDFPLVESVTVTFTLPEPEPPALRLWVSAYRACLAGGLIALANRLLLALGPDLVRSVPDLLREQGDVEVGARLHEVEEGRIAASAAFRQGYRMAALMEVEPTCDDEDAAVREFRGTRFLLEPLPAPPSRSTAGG